MSEAVILRNTAIVRNASIAPPQHGPVKTGALPLVQVRMAPGGPQVQEGQQKPVTILPPRDAASAVATGGLPMVQVKMTQNGPQVDDGRDQPVVIKDGKHAGVNAGGLPMVQVKMDGGKPQVQTIPNVQGGPPQIPAAAPALSAPRVPRAVGVHVARIPAPTRPAATALPSVPELSTDQLMLCRHLVDKYLVDLRAAEGTAENETVVENTKLAEGTISTIDDVMIATAVRAEAAAAAAAPGVTLPTTPSFPAATSVSPAPSVAYVAGRASGQPTAAAGRSYVAAGARSQRNSGMAPRRMARPESPLPAVIVKMDGQRPVVQAQAAVDQAPISAPSSEVPTASATSAEGAA